MVFDTKKIVFDTKRIFFDKKKMQTAVGTVFPAIETIASTIEAIVFLVEITHALHICVFIATGVFVSVLMERLRDAIECIAQAGRKLESRMRGRTAQLAQTNDDLQAEKTKLTGILNQMREAIFIVNSQHEIEYANPAMQRMFGPIGDQKCYQYLDGANAADCERCKNPEVNGASSFREWRSPKNGKFFRTAIGMIRRQPEGSCSSESFRGRKMIQASILPSPAQK